MINRARRVLQPSGNRPSQAPSAASPWQPARDGYVLDQGQLRGKLKLRGLAPGLRQLSLRTPGGSGVYWPGPLLAVETLQMAESRSFRIGDGNSLPVHRVRGDSVDTLLEPSDNCPARVHLYWQASESNRLDLEVLVSTADPWEQLEALTLSQFPAAEVLIRGSGRPRSWLDVRETACLGAEWLVFPRDRDAAAMSLDGRTPRFGAITLARPYCQPLVLCRPPGRKWSYVEMSHPEDCCRIIARIHGDTVRVGFGLFGLDLEKGVILRGRVRALFLPRKRDTDQATRLFRAFATESPHLSV